MSKHIPVTQGFTPVALIYEPKLNSVYRFTSMMDTIAFLANRNL
jgi:hypothetical protein